MVFGGESGIRTRDRVSPIHAFQACAFDHSATSPARRNVVRSYAKGKDGLRRSSPSLSLCMPYKAAVVFCCVNASQDDSQAMFEE